ncbi:hypothetical protein KKH26_02115, partial [Patescibacteria group bacterium]|nr:hypothetical protein [Patescibacteria group bacterium]
LVRLKEQLGKIQYGIDHAKTRSYAAEREVWKAQKISKIEEVKKQIQQWKEKISSAQRESRELK